MIASVPCDRTAIRIVEMETIRIVEMEIASELCGRRLASVVAIAALLLRGQEIDGHPCPPLCR